MNNSLFNNKNNAELKQNKIDYSSAGNKKTEPNDTTNQNTRASPTFKERCLNVYNMLKSNNKKAIKIAVLVIIFCVIVVLYFNISYLDKPKENTKNLNYNYTSTLEYANTLEAKLEKLLGSIKGAEHAKVMVYLEGSLEIILAEKVDEKTNSTSNGSTSNSYVTTVTEPIIIAAGGTSMPLVLTEKLPQVKGIVVVCKGANDVQVKLDIYNAIRALFNIPSGNVEVFAGD